MKNKTFKEDAIIEEDITYEAEQERRRRLLTLILFYLFIIGIIFGLAFSTSHRRFDLYKLKVNIDLDKDGICDLNCDIDGDNLPDINIDFNGDNLPDINITYKNGTIPYFNISYNRDGKIDKNPIEQRNSWRRGNSCPNTIVSRCIVNCDMDDDGKPDLNIDLDGDGIIDLNQDLDGDCICDINCDILGIPKPNYNVDTDGDETPDVNIGPNGGNKPVFNVSYKLDYRDAYFNLINNVHSFDFNTTIGTNQSTITQSNGSTYNLINVDINNDGWPDVNIDLDGDGRIDLNEDLDFDGIADLNIDVDRDTICDLNCDLNGDKTPDMNIDLDNDGEPDLNIDTDHDDLCNFNCDVDGDGVADTNLDNDNDGNVDENPGLEEIDLNINGPHEIVFSDANGKPIFTIVPGWTGTKEFIVKNTSTKVLMYSIDFTGVVNDITIENNLYYGLTKDGVTLKDINTTRAPYTNSNLIENIEIKPGEEHYYVMTFEFKDTGVNQDVDKGKTFYTKLQVRNAV